jgi:hypothetical protein
MRVLVAPDSFKGSPAAAELVTGEGRFDQTSRTGKLVGSQSASMAEPRRRLHHAGAHEATQFSHSAAGRTTAVRSTRPVTPSHTRTR